MNQNEQGMLYPFRLSGSRMRQSAVQLRRQGQVLDALALVRRAAEQDDTPSAWQALAAELRQLGNPEAAVPLLARVLSREPHQPGAWIDMARCLQALGQEALAVDCAYHQLQEDPWAAESDAARAMLAELETIPEAKEPRRTQRLIHRGMTAWQSGDRAMGKRRIHRAINMTGTKERLLVTTAMMCMLEMNFSGALHYLPMALRCNPEDPRTLTAMSTVYHQQGKPRLARALLRKAGKFADSVQAEDGFITAAWAQDAWPEMKAYLNERMKRQPHRVALLSAKATMCCERGNLSAAQQLWKEILSIDPDDRQAASLIADSQDQPIFLCLPGLTPRGEREKQRKELQQAVENQPMSEVLRPGSVSRRVMDWFVGSDDPAERQCAMNLLENSDDHEAVIAYLKELLCWPFLRMELRQWALVRLAQMGVRDEMLMMAGSHYTFVTCQPMDEKSPSSPGGCSCPCC